MWLKLTLSTSIKYCRFLFYWCCKP